MTNLFIPQSLLFLLQDPFPLTQSFVFFIFLLHLLIDVLWKKQIPLIKIKKVSETKGLERLTTKRITFIGKALLLPFYQTTITKQQNKNNQMILLCKNTGNTCCSISSCFFFSVSTAMLNSLASLKEKSGQ